MVGVAEVMEGGRREIAARICGSLLTLLTEKHLYQSVTVPTLDALSLAARAPREVQATTKFDLDALSHLPWMPMGSGGSEGGMLPTSAEKVLPFTPPTVKLFCKVCNGREPYNFAGGSDLLGHKYHQEQIFSLAYLCQACKKIPEVLLVRRSGNKLTLSGRSPMETVEVPSAIPRPIRTFVEGALLAFQANQTLPANFMLRTSIEQWARSSVGQENPGKADKVVERYMASLDTRFKALSPSLQALYEELSADIHAATGSGELFRKSIQQIEQHFRALDVWEARPQEPSNKA